MPKIYSMDLRDKIIKCYQSKEYSFKSMAQIFSVSESTITNIIVRFKKYGEHKIFTETLGRKKLIDKEGESSIKQWIDNKPDITLHSIQSHYEEKYNIKPGTSTLFYHIQRMGYNYKKKVNSRNSN